MATSHAVRSFCGEAPSVTPAVSLCQRRLRGYTCVSPPRQGWLGGQACRGDPPRPGSVHSGMEDSCQGATAQLLGSSHQPGPTDTPSPSLLTPHVGWPHVTVSGWSEDHAIYKVPGVRQDWRGSATPGDRKHRSLRDATLDPEPTQPPQGSPQRFPHCCWASL